MYGRVLDKRRNRIARNYVMVSASNNFNALYLYYILAAAVETLFVEELRTVAEDVFTEL